ncbi:LysR family transcriptional regulator [Sulfitobacter aestuariivivens]|uniref:LysR family transcriptional regulator n=1 Tax=Sulfitobacter aestuariivivens TaxID=2766981 RepID=A0A927HFT1_9RHOB|nr:LysR family transcriptional regulator [Sulfitobacter aestuariivivens]MBD3664749.1 LysR family transcriptional regulator [Sulfitobacter aestuariivivens]
MINALSRLDWNHLRSFLATAETASLSAAARTLGLTQPTLSRQVAALEADLSVMLFERTGRRLILTDAGQELLTHVRKMGEAAEKTALVADGQRSDITGQVRITASDITSAVRMPAITERILSLAPQLSIELVATNDISDLMRREADIAIRHVRPDQPDLVARLVREASGHFYAAKSLLARVGHPRTKADLARMDWVSFGDTGRMIDYMVDLDIPVSADAFRVGSENGIVAWELARAGLGVCPMDDDVAARAPDMERVLPDVLVTFPVWLVTHREIHTSPRIRLVFDLLAEALAA